SASSIPSLPLACAAAPFRRPIQRTTGTGIRSPDTGKLLMALVVSPPHSCSLKLLTPFVLLPGAAPAAPRRGGTAMPASHLGSSRNFGPEVNLFRRSDAA